jgi:hypothetical protein
VFTPALAEVLTLLEAEQRLIFLHKRSTYFVQFACLGAGGLRAEAVSNGYLRGKQRLNAKQIKRLAALGWREPTVTPEPGVTLEFDPGGSPHFFREWEHPVPVAKVTAVVAATLREVYGVLHPSRLQYHALDTGDREILLPTLRIDRVRDARKKETGDEWARILRPRTKAELVQGIAQGLGFLDEAGNLPVDEDGDFPLQYGGALVFIRTGSDDLAVQLFCRVLADVGSNLELLEAVNELNNTYGFVTFAHHNDSVFLTRDIDCDPLVPDALMQALMSFSMLADRVTGELQKHFGGETTFEETPARSRRRRQRRVN